jgi:hypothetical protein
LPGDSDCGHADMMTSKSNSRSRFSYCVLSTVRTVASMPIKRCFVEQRDPFILWCLYQKLDH